jgi:hypothetical protein
MTLNERKNPIPFDSKLINYASKKELQMGNQKGW